MNEPERMSMRRSLLLLATLLASSAVAATGDQRTSRLEIRHTEAFVDLKDADGRTTSDPLATGLAYRVRPNETIYFYVTDPNPLLYTYSWKFGEATTTDNFNAIQSFATAINPLLGTLQTLTGVPKQKAGTTICDQGLSGDAAIMCRAGVDLPFFRDYADRYANLLDFGKRVPQWIKDSSASKDGAEKVKTAVLAHQAVTDAKKLEADLATLRAARDALQATSRSGAAIPHPVGVQVASLSNELITLLLTQEVSSTGGAPLPKPKGQPATPQPTIQPTPAPAPVPASNKKKTASRPSPSAKQVKELKQQLDKANQDLAAVQKQQDKVNSDRIQNEALLIDQYDRAIATLNDADAMLKALNAFVDLVKKINIPIPIGKVTYSATTNQPGTLTIGTVTANASAANPMAKTGDLTWTFSPWNPVDYHVDAGTVYSFIEAPKFEAKAANGKFTVARTDSGNAVNGATIGAMLTIVPRTWSDPTFGGGFQVGISPQTDKLGFYLGAVLRLFDRVSLGGGLAYQQTQRLGSGLQIGTELAAAADLKTNTAFKAGPYISISIKVK
jgi:hypothetical protein